MPHPTRHSAAPILIALLVLAATAAAAEEQIVATDGAMLHMGSLYFPEYGSRFFPGYDEAAVAPSQLLDAKPGTESQTSDTADVLLEVGLSFVDTEHGITIETLGESGGLLEVRVTIDQYCGNGVADAKVGEVCDGADLAGPSCASIGFTSGALACSASCGFDVDDLIVPFPEEVEIKLDIVPPDSPISGPRLEVTYHALPEPDVPSALLAGIVLLAGLARRRRGQSGRTSRAT